LTISVANTDTFMVVHASTFQVVDGSCVRFNDNHGQVLGDIFKNLTKQENSLSQERRTPQ
jgi:hypothetical protein